MRTIAQPKIFRDFSTSDRPHSLGGNQPLRVVGIGWLRIMPTRQNFCVEVLVAINLIDFERVREGIILTIRRSKTDQDGVGRKIGIPFGRTIHCPVRALENWLSIARIEDGPVFRPVDRHGRVSAGRLSGEAVSLILRVRMAAAGFDPAGYSGHSLRAGFVTSGTRAGVSTFKIRQQTGHASDAMLSRYVRDGELFLGNAAGILL
jgi:integrase